MHSNEYEAAFGRFLEQAEYDKASDALFSLRGPRFRPVGWRRAAQPERIFTVLRPEAGSEKP